MKPSLLSLKVLGNFNAKEDTGKTAIMWHDAIESYDSPLRFQYGGDIAANVLLAAASRVPSETGMKPNSLHIEYINPGDMAKPREYCAERLRESPRFIHTMVKINQGDNYVAIGKVLFHNNEHSEDSLSFSPTFPEECLSPYHYKDDDVLLKEYEKKYGDSEVLRPARTMVSISHWLGFNARPVDPEQYFRLSKEPIARLSFWMKCNETEIAKVYPDIEDRNWSAALLAYMSDYRIMSPALRQNVDFRPRRTATMSHMIWYNPLTTVEMKTPTDWILFDGHAHVCGNNTVLCEANMWNENKELLATAKQQGLVRPYKK